jgi:predicted nucleic acid-binding protein
VSEAALVDTQLWEYACLQQVASPSGVHSEAATFLDRLFSDPGTQVHVTAYQMAEIMEVLRKAGLPEAARRTTLAVLQTNCQCVDLDADVALECVELSLRSGIHVYDYLVAVPLRGLVDVIYSADRHFLQDPEFGAVAPVVNPVTWEMQEGQPPRPRSS